MNQWAFPAVARVTMNWFTLDTILRCAQVLATRGKQHELQPKVDRQCKKAVEQTNQVEPRPNSSQSMPFRAPDVTCSSP